MAKTRIVWSRFNRSFTRQQLVSALPNGKHRRVLTHPGKDTFDIDASISPNGRRVAFERDTDDAPALIALMGANGQNKHRVDLRCPDSCLGDLTPTWLPSGDRIAFTQVLGPEDPVTHNAASAVLYTARPDGSHKRRLSEPGIKGKFEDYRADFSPDGGYVVFQRLKLATDQSALFRMGINSRHVRRLTPWNLNADTQDLSLATHGPTKDLVAFETYGHGGPPRGKSSNVATVPSTCAPVSECRKQISYVTHHRQGKRQSYNPSWSPNGRRIAYVRQREVDSNTFIGDIWTTRPDGTHRRAVSTSPLFEYRPDWGPAPKG
jgi:Tol biopolymer transport system component